MWACDKVAQTKFLTAVNKTNTKGLPGKTRGWLVKPLCLLGAFAKKIICYYGKIFCWSDGRGIQYVSLRVMLNKGNRKPQWQVVLEANGRPRQIKSNGHLSCWQLKSHLSNYSWCLALRSDQSFNRGTNDVKPGTVDCFIDQWTSSGSKLSWKTINNCFTSSNTFATCDGSRRFLATFLLDIGDGTELERETIDAPVRGQSLSEPYSTTERANHTSSVEIPSLIISLQFLLGFFCRRCY